MWSLLFTKSIMQELLNTFLFEKLNPAFHTASILSSLQLGNITPLALVSFIIACATLISKIIDIRQSLIAAEKDEIRKQEEHEANEKRKDELHKLALDHTDKLNKLIQEGELEKVLTLTQIENE